MKFQHFLAVFSLILFSSNAHSADIPNGKALGYTINGCHSEYNSINYCSKKYSSNLQAVLDKAKKITKPNFDNNKKIIAHGYRNPNKKVIYSYITDIFIINEKAKTIHVFPHYVRYESDSTKLNKSSPTSLLYKANSDVFCLADDLAAFEYTEVEGHISPHQPTYLDENIYSCVKFNNGDYIMISDSSLDNAIQYIKELGL